MLTREFAKQGCIKSLRGKLWAQMLNVKIDSLDKVYYNYLKNSVLEYDLLIDTIYYRVNFCLNNKAVLRMLYITKI